jgi:hypothetical protein
MLKPVFKLVNPAILGKGVKFSFDSIAIKLPFIYFLITVLFCPSVSLSVSITSPVRDCVFVN